MSTSSLHTPRISFSTSSERYRLQAQIETYLAGTGLDHRLLELVKFRASLINGCAFCLDMHARDARRAGETEQRLYVLGAWREARHFFTEAEQAALELTECVTRISEHGVPDDVYERARQHFNEEQYLDLLTAICQINVWNRLVISTGQAPVLRPEHK